MIHPTINRNANFSYLIEVTVDVNYVWVGAGL